ncbi:MAG: Clp1/GlmU family protein [Candidatus Helarchaeota archaeon]
MELNLKKKEALQIHGPSKIRVIDGEIEVFGKKIKNSESIILKMGKSVPIEAILPTKIVVNTESKENIEKLIEPPISEDKKQLFEHIKKIKKPCKILFIGGTDTGKSSLIAYLGNQCYENGLKTAVLDLDVGQQDIGLPSTIGYGIMTDLIYDTKEISKKTLYFIGNTTPSGCELRCLTGISNLLRNKNEIEVTLIDTCGWISGIGARGYKLAKIELIKPDIIIALQRENEIEHLLKPFEKTHRIFRIPVSKNIYAKTFNARRFLREVSFRNYFSNAKSISLKCDEISFTYTLFKTGTCPNDLTLKKIEDILELKAEYCEICKDGIFFVSAEEKFWKLDNLNLLRDEFRVQHIHIAQKKDEIGILVGLIGDTQHLGMGIIEKIDYNNNTIDIFTTVAKDKIKQIQFSFMKISKSGNELEKIRPFF